VRLQDALSPAGVTLPGSLDARIAALVLAGPAMLRWSYLLRDAEPNRAFMQRINLQIADESGYVPLTADPTTTARALASRAALRRELGLPALEGPQEVLENDGWIVSASRGTAWLPVGLGHEQLAAACGPSGTLDHAKRVLARPGRLECILVSDGSSGRRGISVDTGEEVPVP
jgi:hypothetical protein